MHNHIVSTGSPHCRFVASAIFPRNGGEDAGASHFIDVARALVAVLMALRIEDHARWCMALRDEQLLKIRMNKGACAALRILAQPCEDHQNLILSLVRLPIPPLSHFQVTN